MQIEILDDDGNVINLINASADFAEKHYPGRWREAGATPVQALAEAKAVSVHRMPSVQIVH